jgi:hypothetical protein
MSVSAASKTKHGDLQNFNVTDVVDCAVSGLLDREFISKIPPNFPRLEMAVARKQRSYIPQRTVTEPMNPNAEFEERDTMMGSAAIIALFACFIFTTIVLNRETF